MALPLALASPSPCLCFLSPQRNPHPLSSAASRHPPPPKTPFLPSTPSSYKPPINLKSKKTKPTTAAAVKIVRCPALDRNVTKHHRLRFARKLTTLLLSKPRHFLPLRVLSRCRRYLGVPPSRPLLPLILRYPLLFRLSHTPSFTSPTFSLLSVSLTPESATLAARLSSLRSSLSASLAANLQRLLMLASPHHRLLLSDVAHLATDLGLPPDFRSRLPAAHPDRFRTAGAALVLSAWDPDLAQPLPPILPPPRHRPIIDRPPKFKQLRLRRGLNLKRRHRDSLIRFHELPPVSPYSREPRDPTQADLAEKERRACAVVREILGMTMEKRTLVDHLTHFRKQMGLPNRLRAMLVRHPEMFYISRKGDRDSVFLVEAYDDDGRLLVEDELRSAREGLAELVREGKRMRREIRRGVLGDDEDGHMDDDDDDDEEEYGDGFDDLFDSGIGDDWEDFGAAEVDDVHGYGIEGSGIREIDFWSMKTIDEDEGCVQAW